MALGLEEFSERIGENTEFAATITCTPDEDNEWMGYIKFDNNAFNWPEDFPAYDGKTPIRMYLDWRYPFRKSGGTYLMNLLMRWYGDIVAFIQRMRGDTPARPTTVCLCGSTRFSEAYQKANLEETLKGNIVLTIGCDMKSDSGLFDAMSEAERDAVKNRLDELHLRKIDLADEVLILNVGGYVGESTKREIQYAVRCGKVVRFLETKQSEEAK